MNESTVIDRCVSGAALAPLSNEQRQELARLALRAYAHAYPSPSQPRPLFDDWRHEQVKIACERDGLRQAHQEDYALVKAHLLRIVGQGAQANRMEDRAQLEQRRVALHKLGQECKAAADVIENGLSYVRSIARARYHGAGLDALNEKQIWGLIFDLRRNAQRRRAKGRAA